MFLWVYVCLYVKMCVWKYCGFFSDLFLIREKIPLARIWSRADILLIQIWRKNDFLCDFKPARLFFFQSKQNVSNRKLAPICTKLETQCMLKIRKKWGRFCYAVYSVMHKKFALPNWQFSNSQYIPKNDRRWIMFLVLISRSRWGQKWSQKKIGWKLSSWQQYFMIIKKLRHKMLVKSRHLSAEKNRPEHNFIVIFVTKFFFVIKKKCLLFQFLKKTEYLCLRCSFVQSIFGNRKLVFS